jgi:threonine/homoserine/homoserine lactone efflux protein
MPIDTFLASLVFAFVASATPGPNNFMLLASGANFGFRKTVPHMFGIAVGFGALLLAAGLSLGAMLNAVPAFRNVVKAAGGAYLVYLAWKIASSRGASHSGETRAGARPMSFWNAAMFQWVNPKGWVMSISAMALFTNAERPIVSVFLVMAWFLIAVGPSVVAWAGFGTALRGFLAEPRRLKWFNISMGIVLAATLAASFI